MPSGSGNGGKPKPGANRKKPVAKDAVFARNTYRVNGKVVKTEVTELKGKAKQLVKDARTVATQQKREGEGGDPGQAFADRYGNSKDAAGEINRDAAELRRRRAAAAQKAKGTGAATSRSDAVKKAWLTRKKNAGK